MRSSIQITKEEDREIEKLKGLLQLPSKRAVVLEGLKELREKYRQSVRRRRLREASFKCREESKKINREMAPFSTATKAL